jgi:hypothetical protein
MRHGNPGRALEQLAEQVVRRPYPARGEGDLAGMALGVDDELADGLDRQFRGDGEDEGSARDHADRNEVLGRVVRQFPMHVRLDRQRRHRGEQQRVAVRRSLGHGRRAGDRAGAGTILDHNRLAENLSELLPELAGHDIGAAARRVRNHQCDRPRGKFLRERGRNRAEHRDRGAKCANAPSASHGFSSHGRFPTKAGGTFVSLCYQCATIPKAAARQPQTGCKPRAFTIALRRRSRYRRTHRTAPQTRNVGGPYMRIKHRAVVRTAAALVALVCGMLPFVSPAMSQAYPARPIRAILPLSPGGLGDVFLRALGQELWKSLGQPVVVENKPGANTVIGGQACAQAAPDGYTICLLAVDTLSNAPWLTKNLPYDPDKGFAPITQAFFLTEALVVHPPLPVSSLQELIAYSKAKPGRSTMPRPPTA